MKFSSSLAVAGILTLIGYGHTIRQIPSESCEYDPGYVYILRERYRASLYKIIGSSAPPPLYKIGSYNSDKIIEKGRFPVRNCNNALSAVLTAVRTSEFQEFPPNLGQSGFLVLENQYMDFHNDIETAIKPWVSVDIPPFNQMQSCRHSDGYFNIFILHVGKYHNPSSDLHCVRVFGSSNNGYDFLTSFKLIYRFAIHKSTTRFVYCFA